MHVYIYIYFFHTYKCVVLFLRDCLQYRLVVSNSQEFSSDFVFQAYSPTYCHPEVFCLICACFLWHCRTLDPWHDQQIHLSMCVYYACMYSCICIHLCMFMYVSTYIHVFVCFCMFMCICTYIYVCMSVCMRVRGHVCMSVYVYVWVGPCARMLKDSRLKGMSVLKECHWQEGQFVKGPGVACHWTRNSATHLCLMHISVVHHWCPDSHIRDG